MATDTGVSAQHTVFGKVRSTAPARSARRGRNAQRPADQSSSSTPSSASSLSIAGERDTIAFASGSSTSGNTGADNGDGIGHGIVDTGEGIPAEGKLVLCNQIASTAGGHAPAKSSSAVALKSKNIRELKKLALAEGCSTEIVEAQDDTDDTKAALIKLIQTVKREKAEAKSVRRKSSDSSSSQEGNLPTSTLDAPDFADNEERHKAGHCIPCTYVVFKQGCKYGADCQMCHLAHGPRPSKSMRMAFKRIAGVLDALDAGKKEEFDKTALAFIKQGGYLRKVVRSRLQELGRSELDLDGSETLIEEGMIPYGRRDPVPKAIKSSSSSSSVAHDSRAHDSRGSTEAATTTPLFGTSGSASSQGLSQGLPQSSLPYSNDRAKKILGSRTQRETQREPRACSAVKQAYKLAL